MLNRQVVVLKIFLVLLGIFEDVAEFAIHPGFVTTVGLGQFRDFFVGGVSHHQRCLSEF